MPELERAARSMVLVTNPSLPFFGEAVNRIPLVRRMVVLLALALSVLPLLTSQALAQDDVGLPIHPGVIPSTIARQSGAGEGTRWVKVHFKINAPYKQVVKFYREKVGRGAQVSQIDSGKLLNTLILFSQDPADQFNVNISSERGGKVTEVELSRNFVRP
ncbi:MAG: hypothetical protein KGL31_08180 [candidate division NC10 bacterium]|nr:hypothetical protein [candidate division NC10 bacterium]